MGETHRTIVHYGPPSVERNRSLFEFCLRSWDSSATPFLYVVATRVRQRQLQELFLSRFPQVFEIPILTFPKLVQVLLAAAGARRRRISETERLCLLEGILQDSSGESEQTRQQLGSRLARLNQIVSFAQQHYLLDEQQLRLRYQRWEGSIGSETDSLFECYSRYQRLLQSREAEDAAGASVRLYESLLTGAIVPKSAVPGLRVLAFEGYYHFTPVQLGILRMLASELEEMHFSVDWDSPERNLDRFSDALGDTVDLWQDLEATWRFYPGRPNPLRVYFSEPDTQEAEVRRLASQICRTKLEQPGLQFSNIAVICSRSGSYEIYIREIFSTHNIPLVWFSATSAPGTHAARLLVEYVRLLQRDFHRDQLFDLLSSPWIEVGGLSKTEIRLLEKAALQVGIVQGLQQWTVDFSGWIKRYVQQLRQEGKDADAATLEASYIPFRDFVEALNLNTDSTRTLAQWLQDLSRKIAPFSKLLDGSPSWVRRENLSLKAHQDSLRNLALAWEARLLTLDRARFALSQLVSQPHFLPELDQDGVAVGTSRDFQQCEFRVIYWLGFGEGQFPGPPRNIALVGQQEGDQGTPGLAQGIKEEAHLFHGVRFRASEAVYFSNPKRIGSATSHPSPFLRHLEATRIEGPVPSRSQPQTDPEPDRQAELLANLRLGLQVQAGRESTRLSHYEGVFRNDRVISELRETFFPEGISVSPSRLEDYVECGFRYYVRRLLEVEAPESADEGVPSREMGRIIHRILYRFFQKTIENRDKEQSLSLEDAKSLMLRIASEELKLLGGRYQRTRDLIWQDQVGKLLQGLDGDGTGLLASLLEQHWQRPPDSEVHFVEQPISLVLGHLDPAAAVPIRLTGVIDRMDSTESGYAVLDYKTGETSPLKKLQGGWGFQLPLYLLAAKSMLDKEVLGAAFYVVSLPLRLELKPLTAFVERDLHATSPTQLTQEYSQKAVAVAQQLYQGHFPVTILGARAAGCRTCPYSRMCRVDRAKMERARDTDSIFPTSILSPSFAGRRVGLSE